MIEPGDDLYIPASRAQKLVEDIKEFLDGDPTSDEEWQQMLSGLLDIQEALVEILKDNDQI